MHATTSALTEFQDAFAAALLDPDASPADPMAALARQPGFAVYRNTVMKGCIDALQANYPAVTRLVGEEWFRAAAAVFVRAQPPRLPMLAGYGADFATFLESFEPARELPYLPAVAKLDRAWTEAHQAADARALDAVTLAASPPEQLAGMHLAPHPAARWQWFDLPAYSIWSRNRGSEETELSDDADIEWQAEGVLVCRDRAGIVRWQPLTRGGCVFLDACAAGHPLQEATAFALDADPALDFAALISQLLAAGALAEPPSHATHTPGEPA
jgi:hypothetical protein